MARRLLVGALGGGACLLFASLGHAQCQSDKDCPGQLICEGARCITPPPASAVAAAPPAAAAAPPAAPPARAQPTPPTDTPTPPRRGKRHSQVMFVSGIVITSLAPVGGFITGIGMLCGLTEGSKDCGKLILAGLATTGVLLGVGLPLLLIGAHREPLATARLIPWLTPQSAGVGLRFEL